MENTNWSYRDSNYNTTLNLAIICKIFSVKKFFLIAAKINMNYQNTYNNGVVIK